jgi:hypothetical protein
LKGPMYSLKPPMVLTAALWKLAATIYMQTYVVSSPFPSPPPSGCLAPACWDW